MLIDTHCHLNFKDFKEDADKVIKRSLEGGVQLINIGSQYSTSQRAVDYANKYKNGVWATIGIHPVHLFYNAEFKKAKIEKFDYNRYLKLAKNDKVVAIGEVGLDYHHFESFDNVDVRLEIYKAQIQKIIKKQKEVFGEFIKLANEVDKPIAIHCWNADKKDKELVEGAVAYEDILKILDKNPVNKKGVVHSFIGNYKTAQKFIDKGFLLGVNGIVTYSESYDRLIKEVGLESIILETDAPFLTPVPLEKYSRN